jgi:DNA-binding IclR family transcriptional regulator
MLPITAPEVPQAGFGQDASPRGPNVSVLSRMSALLNSFSISKPALTVAEAAGLIGASEATAYRYLGELCHAGLLAKRTGSYVLGPKIIELEYITQTCDPIMRAGEKVMRDLADTLGCHVLLCNIYHETIVNVFHAVGRDPLPLTFTKGRPMPLFRGSQARAILAFLERRRLRRSSIATRTARNSCGSRPTGWPSRR